jgi:hypothetical protein
LPVIARTYELVRWSCAHVARFPRSYRCTLGDRVEHRLYDVLDGLIRARYVRDRAPILKAVNMDLELLRFQFRLAHDLRCLSAESYGFAARSLNDIGQMVGGWLRCQEKK